MACTVSTYLTAVLRRGEKTKVTSTNSFKTYFHVKLNFKHILVFDFFDLRHSKYEQLRLKFGENAL